MTISVLIADDQELVRTGFKMILNAQPNIEVVGEAANGREAVVLAKKLQPDVCLFDIRMPEMDGLEATRELAGPEVKNPLAIIIVTTFDLDEYVHGALKAGACGFLLKDAGPEALFESIHAAASGEAMIAPMETIRLLSNFARSGEPTRRKPVEPLTDREEEVVLAVANGRSNAEIAEELFISTATVKTHVAHLMAKIVARNRVELAIWVHDTRRT